MPGRKPVLVRLSDGTEVDSASEAWRHECEARHILNIPALAERRNWLYGRLDAKGEARGGLLQRRGPEAVAQMEATMLRLWKLREAEQQQQQADLATA